MTDKVQLGISTCPNDTFAFHGLMTRRVDWRGLDFEVTLLDVQELNQRLFEGEFDVAKASFHAALLLADEVGVLPSGSALGYGVGPLLLAARKDTTPSNELSDTSRNSTRRAIVACPGEQTTATLLYHLFYPAIGELRQMVFSEVMPALQRHECDFGVCIHEGRFTYEEQGLSLVEDLGTRWEKETGTPLPLGGIVARHRLGAEKLARIQAVVRDSLEYGLCHREETAETMRRYAQEMSDDVLYAHVDLYVNDWTLELGTTGQQALDQLNARAQSVGILTNDQPRLRVLDC